MDKSDVKRLNICFVEVMNSKRQVMRKLGHMVQIHVCRKRPSF